MGARSGSLVLLHDPSVLLSRTGEVARIVAKALREPVPDVAQRIRNGGGILARGLAPSVAEEIVADVGAAGVAVFAVPSEDGAITMPRTRRLAGITIGEQGLTGSTRGSAKREDIPWSRIRALHVNVFARKLSPEEVEDGRPTRALPDVERVSEEVCRLSSEINLWEDRERNRRVEICLDIVAEKPLLVGRVNAEEADYASLPDKTDSALANFVQLARNVAKAAPAHVVVPPSTRRFVETLDWKGVLFEKPEPRESWNLWLVLAVRHGKPFGASPGAAARADDAEAAEDVSDEELEATDEAVVVGPDEDSSDAEDLSDDDAEDELEGDAEVAQALEHFDETRRLRTSDVAELVAAAQEIGDDASLETEDGPPANVEAELQFFEEPKTGRWDASEIVKDSHTLEDEDVADDEKDPGA